MTDCQAGWQGLRVSVEECIDLSPEEADDAR